MTKGVAKMLLVASTAGCVMAANIRTEVKMDFSDASIIGVFKTTATLQVVSNPLLDRNFALPNGTKMPNPIHKAAWNSLRELGADHVRFQPWFPYPAKAVPELVQPQEGKPTSWDFSKFMPQMEDFMANTAEQGHPVTWNIGTVPCWLFRGPTTGRKKYCPFPNNSDVSDFAYGTRGIRAFLKDLSGKTLADYYARVTSYLVNGYMVDEHGVVHRGGPAYNFSAANGHIFEFLNEGEHYYTPDEYINDYDVTVPAIQSALLKRAPSFMGIGGCADGHWNWWVMPNCTVWLEKFLNQANHKRPDIPLEWASIHYYATTDNRSDVSSYTKNFFGSADKWLVALDANIAQRDRLSPKTKLALTELGILMVDDMSANFGKDGGLPDMYFNAAAAFLAYTSAQVAIKGIDIATFSQFVGSPAIPEWGIDDMQFPSGTMISWETGLGNAKYWVLKLLLDHIHKGDSIVKSPFSTTSAHTQNSVQHHMCTGVGPWTFNNEVTLTCNDPNARIDYVWADMGLQPSGQCGSYKPNVNCTNHLQATLWANAKCLGRHSCTLQKPNTATSGLLACPIKTYIKQTSQIFSERLTVQARCTGTMGGHTSAEYSGDSIFSVGFVSPDKKSKKLLLVNKEAHRIDVRISGSSSSQSSINAYIVDPRSVSRSSAQGIRVEKWAPDQSNSAFVVTLQPYAVAVAVIGEDHIPQPASVLI